MWFKYASPLATILKLRRRGVTHCQRWFSLLVASWLCSKRAHTFSLYSFIYFQARDACSHPPALPPSNSIQLAEPPPELAPRSNASRKKKKKDEKKETLEKTLSLNLLFDEEWLDSWLRALDIFFNISKRLLVINYFFCLLTYSFLHLLTLLTTYITYNSRRYLLIYSIFTYFTYHLCYVA